MPSSRKLVLAKINSLKVPQKIFKAVPVPQRDPSAKRDNPIKSPEIPALKYDSNQSETSQTNHGHLWSFTDCIWIKEGVKETDQDLFLNRSITWRKKSIPFGKCCFFFFETDNDDVDSSMRVLSKKKIIKEEIRKLPHSKNEYNLIENTHETTNLTDKRHWLLYCPNYLQI